IPLNKYLDTSFFEPYKEATQSVTKVANGTVLKYGVGQMRPAWEERSTDYPPLSTYKWADAEKALNQLAKAGAASPFDDIALEYTNPHSGGSVMKTIACWIQMLRPGVHTQAHRQVGSTVYCVFEGEGATIIDGQRFDWQTGDLFVIPSWACHEHYNASTSERAILFSINDMPVMKALGKYREEAYTEYNGHQVVTSMFKEKYSNII
ncbi:MAG: cupin domain-containing protein, partial [Caldilineaceae bacterium]